jgi:membrane protein YdbS with pleckstrin-like domain
MSDGTEHRLDPRHIDLSRLIGWITSAWVASASFMMLAIATFRSGGTLAMFGVLTIGWVVANVLLAWHLQRWPAISHDYTSYRLDDQGIEIRRGVIWRRVINVPRSRVQHTDVSQGPLERQYGLGTLIIHTAGTEHARVALGGLAHPDALRLREQVLPVGGGDAV